jgi:subtilisin family serine protease
MALIDVRDETVKQKISADKSIRNKIFAHKYSGYDDAPFHMTGDIIMQPKDGVSVEDILAKNEVDAESVTKTDVGVIVRLKDWGKLLSAANAIHESEMVDWCHPDFICYFERMTNDQYFSQQYYLKNTGQTGGTSGIDINVELAWTITTGAGIRVAVIDDGVEDHDDLAGRVLNGYTPRNPNGTNSNGGNGRPYPANINPRNGLDVGHGQACAGIIAASHNTTYTAGVAPGAVIIPINIFYGGETVYDYASAIEYAWNPNKGNADVISNSWGYSNGPPIGANAITQQIDNALREGRLRNGVRRGCVVVFSSGNRTPYGPMAYPASLSNVIAVGAVDESGTVWNYSNRGNTLDVVAPSGNIMMQGDVYTLDRMGSYGYETGNYTSRFGGTSAACPQVAGVAALVLSANPNLTQKQVADRIESTAQKAGPYYYSAAYLRPNGTWNDQTGYGLVNAIGAVINTGTSVSPVMRLDLNYRSPSEARVYIENPYNVSGVYYEWEFNGSPSSWGGGTAEVIVPYNMFSFWGDDNVLRLRCRAVLGSAVSPWSAPLLVYAP